MSDLTHFDESGASRMVDVGEKPITRRVAVAEAIVTMRPETLELIRGASASPAPEAVTMSPGDPSPL